MAKAKRTTKATQKKRSVGKTDLIQVAGSAKKASKKKTRTSC